MSNNNKLSDDINHNHDNIENKIEILNITNTSSIDKQELRGSKYKVRGSSISIDSNKTNPKSNNKRRNSNEIIKIIEILKDNYKSSGKIKNTPTHQIEPMPRRQNTTVQTVINLLRTKNQTFIIICL